MPHWVQDDAKSKNLFLTIRYVDRSLFTLSLSLSVSIGVELVTNPPLLCLDEPSQFLK